MGEDGNCDECSGLLHCHYFLYAYPCLCCSHLHTDMSNFHPHEGILYVCIQHLVSQKWALSSDISKALTRLGASSKSSAAIGLAGNARDGKWVPTQVAPQCVRSAHKNACASAMATAAAALQLQWDPRTDASVPNDEATNASQPSNSDTSPSQTSTTPSSPAIFFLLCVSPFGAETPKPGERLGFNLVCKKCSPQNCKRGGGCKSRVGGSCPKYPPPRFPPFSPVFPPYQPPFSLRFPPFFPVFPRFSLLPGTKGRLGTGTLAS